ncbi:MAG: cation:proton antiporter [Nocardioidaceae bacterium]
MQPDPAFLVELGLLLVLLGAAGTLAWRIGLSSVPLFLLAGLLVGEGSALPVPSAAPFLEFAAAIGVVLLLLALGLEFSAAEFTQSLRRHAPSGVVDLVLNATPGAAAGLLLGLPMPGVVALAGVTWVSSSGIVSRTVVDLGRLGYRETPAVLSVLVLEDVAMAAYLPLLGVLLAGDGATSGMARVTIAVGAVLTVIIAARRAGPPLARLLAHDSDEQVLFRVLGLTLLVAGGAEYLGVSSAVGAFLVGLAISGRTALTARALLEPLRNLFAAAFFLSFGYHVDPADLPAMLPVAVALALVSAASKIGTGWYAARRDGVGTRGRWRAGTLLIPRGEFSIVIAGLAVSAGVAEVGPLATTYVLLVAVAGPVLARVPGPRRDRPGRGSGASGTMTP